MTGIRWVHQTAVNRLFITLIAAGTLLAHNAPAHGQEPVSPKKSAAASNPDSPASGSLEFKYAPDIELGSVPGASSGGAGQSTRRASKYTPLDDEPGGDTKPATDAEVVEAAKDIEGVNLTRKDLELKKNPTLSEIKRSKGFTLNPLQWFYEPISDMQETIVKLEQQIMRLQAPIGSLQKPMLGLRRDIRQIDREIEDVRSEMNQIGKSLNETKSQITATTDAIKTVNGSMGATKDELSATKAEVVSTKQEISDTKVAVAATKKEIATTTHAVVSTKNELATTNKEMREVHSTISRMGRKLDELEMTVKELRAPIKDLPRPVAGVEQHLANLEDNLQLLRESVNLTSNLILFAILASCLMVCLGTPIMALLAYKYRKRILQSFHQQPTLEDDSEGVLAGQMPHKSYSSLKPVGEDTGVPMRLRKPVSSGEDRR